MNQLFFSVIGVITVTVKLYASPLYPYESESREIRSLDGLWTFRTSPFENPDAGFEKEWFKTDLEKTGPCLLMPVPSSYNDITVDASLKDYVGWVWYQRYFYIPDSWINTKKTIYVRFGSVHYTAKVWTNGQYVGGHVGGHLPFQVDISNAVKAGLPASRVRLTVAVNNTLTNLTLPQMQIDHKNDTSKYPLNYIERKQLFDFFNYAGIHRPVVLIALPKIHIEDIFVKTTFNLSNNLENKEKFTGYVAYEVVPSSSSSNVICKISIVDMDETTVAKTKGCSNNVTISDVHLWWTRDLSPNPGYLYTLKVELLAEGELDVYYLPFGVRTVTWNETKIFINNVPTYLHGFGMHEDSILRGKGLDLVHLVRDFEIIKWLGANAFRTSHYPYSEEVLNMADKFGIMVIAESPACTIEYFGEELLKYHHQVMKEIISRDKNRPSVIMWSLSNEPRSHKPSAGPYFESLAKLVRSLDTRPVTFVTSATATSDAGVKYMDIVCFNRYVGWYQESGHLELIERQTINEISLWHNMYKRPVIISEYGAGSLAGFHQLPSVMYTEDYQAELLQKHFKAFDAARHLLAGELIWNFQDFSTPQATGRAGGCMKGLVTRERQPKMAAYVARWRYRQLAKIANASRYHDMFLNNELEGFFT